MKCAQFFALFLLPALAVAAEPKTAWQEWLKKEKAHFHETQFNNPFTLFDAADLGKGDTVFASIAKDARKVKFTRERPAGEAAEFSFDGERLRMRAGDEVKESFAESKWKAPGGYELSASSVRRGRVKVFVYDLRENRFRDSLLPYFPFNPAAVVAAKLDRSKANEKAKILTTLGDERNYRLAGELKFNFGGREQALQAFVPSPDKPRELFVAFKDATNGKETYGAGRYVEVELASEDATDATLDLNRAYHPYCLYSEYFNCPVVLGNRIDGAVRAGAKVPKGLKASAH